MMKQIKVHLQRFWLLILAVLFQSFASGQTCSKSLSAECSSASKRLSGCTIFTISKDNQVFFGGNDDYIEPDSYYWVDSGDDQHYGAIWIGQPDNVQQGVNVHGLAYDANGLPRVDVNPHNERLPVEGGYSSYPIHILQECATVEEVINWIKTHRWHSYMHDQLQFADSTGDAVVISAGTDGELVFTRKPQGNGFLVSTNFNIAQSSNGDYPCWRYDRAQELLSQLVKEEGQLTAADMSGVLDAVHLEGVQSWTIESLLADLSNGLVYIYYFHQFDKPIVLNVKEEVAHPKNPGPLSILFPEEVKQEAAHRYQHMQEKSKLCGRVGMIWAVLVITCVILFFVLSRVYRRRSGHWFIAIVFLGPLAFLPWLMVGHKYKESTWRAVITETTGDVMPSVLAFTVMLCILIMVPSSQKSWPFQIVILFVLPVMLGWLLFHGLLLAVIAGKKQRHFLLHRFPHVLVVTNLTIAGISIVAMPMVRQSLLICSIMPLSAWTVVVWWIIVVSGSLPGGALVFIYDHWFTRHGFQAWNFIAWKKGDVRTPSWRKLWWWVLLSYVALFAALKIGVILQQ
jgi:hypothetical protein